MGFDFGRWPLVLNADGRGIGRGSISSGLGLPEEPLQPHQPLPLPAESLGTRRNQRPQQLSEKSDPPKTLLNKSDQTLMNQSSVAQAGGHDVVRPMHQAHRGLQLRRNGLKGLVV